VDFAYPAFAAVLALNGLAMGLFSAPNRAAIMNSLPPGERGVGAGMTSTFQNSATVLSIGVFFSMLILGLAATLPTALSTGLTAHGVPATVAGRVAALPPVSTLFAALLGDNPVQSLFGPGVLAGLSPQDTAYLTGRAFFPQLIAGPFAAGLTLALGFAAAACLVAAVASALRGRRYVHREPAADTNTDDPGATETTAAA
jgi:hypothetical protein